MALINHAARARRRPRASWARAASAVGVLAVAVAVAACGNGAVAPSGTSGATAGGFTQAAQTSGPLTVWVDSTRVPAAQAYEKAHPNVKLNVVTYDGDANGSNTLQTKVDLYDRTGSGWPDVVFSAESNEVSWAQPAGFTAPLSKGLIPSSVLSQFSTGALAPCTVERRGVLPAQRPRAGRAVVQRAADEAVGLPGSDDLAAVRADRAGGRQAAPGLHRGRRGGYLRPGDLHVGQPVPGQRRHRHPVGDGERDHVRTASRMASLLDTLLADKSMSKLSAFSSAFDKQEQGKVLMMPGPGLVRRSRSSTAPPA